MRVCQAEVRVARFRGNNMAVDTGVLQAIVKLATLARTVLFPWGFTA